MTPTPLGDAGAKRSTQGDASATPSPLRAAGAKRSALVIALSLALGIAGVAWVGGGAVLDPATYRAAHPAPFTLLAIAVALAANWFAPALRLVLLARLHGTPLALGTAAWMHVAFMLGSAVTPSGSGGAPVLVAALGHHGMRWGRAIAVAMQVFVLDLLFFAWAAPVSLLGLSLTPSVPLPPALPWGVGAAVMVVLALALLLIRFPRVAARSILALGKHPWLRRVRARRRGIARDFLRASRSFDALPPRATIALQGVQALAWGGNFLLFWALLSLYVAVDVAPLLATLTLASLLSFVMPTPGASGFMEVAVGLGVSGQVAREVAAAPLLLWRVGSFYAVFAFGPIAVWILTRAVRRGGA